MSRKHGFNKMVSADSVLHYYSSDSTVLVRTTNNGEKTVSEHSDNCNNLYRTEHGKKVGLDFTVVSRIKTTHDSQGNKLPEKKNKNGVVIEVIGSQVFLPHTIYHTDLMRIPFARQFGYNNVGHSKTFLRKKGIRSAQGKVIGD